MTGVCVSQTVSGRQRMEVMRFPQHCLGHPARHKRTESSMEGNANMPAGSGRLEKRIRLAVAVEISNLQDPSATERTSTENLCSLGVRVLTRRPKKLNERLMIRSLEGSLRTLARVVYCQRLADGRFGVGMQFLGAGTKWGDDSKAGTPEQEH